MSDKEPSEPSKEEQVHAQRSHLAQTIAALQKCKEGLPLGKASEALRASVGHQLGVYKEQLMALKPLNKRIANTQAFIDRKVVKYRELTRQLQKLTEERDVMANIITNNTRTLAMLKEQARYEADQDDIPVAGDVAL